MASQLLHAGPAARLAPPPWPALPSLPPLLPLHPVRRRCGYHSFSDVVDPSTGRVVQLKWGFVGATSQCFSACSNFQGQADPTSINGNPEADGTASILAHEIVEVISDPNFDSW